MDGMKRPMFRWPAWLLLLPGLASNPASATELQQTVALADLPVPHAFVAAAPATGQIVVRGVSAYAPSELLAFAAAYDLTARRTATLEGALASIEQVYREDGYLLAEALAGIDPDSGDLVIQVHEGFIASIEVHGVEGDLASTVESYFTRLIGQRPLHRTDFERALMLASDLSGLDLRSEFVFQSDGDGATLRLSGARLRQAGSFSIDNVPLPGDDAARGYFVQEFYSLFNGGDLLRLLAVMTHEFEDSYSLAGTVFFRSPVGSSGTYVEAFVGNAFSSRNYGDLTARGDQLGLNAALAFGQAIRRDLHGYLYALAEYEYQDAESRLGLGDFQSIAHAGRLHLVRGVSDAEGGQTLASLVMSAGGRPDRASGEPDDGDRNFAHLRGSLGLIRPLTALHDHVFIRTEVMGQWSDDSLPQVEKFAIGHWPYLRGYAPAEEVGDSGYAGTAELSYVFDGAGRSYRSIAPFAFFDFGAVSNNATKFALPGTGTLYSAGVGTFASLGWATSLSAWLAVPLEDGLITESGDPGFYLAFSKSWGR